MSEQLQQGSDAWIKNQMRQAYRLANGRRDGKDKNRIWRKPQELSMPKPALWSRRLTGQPAPSYVNASTMQHQE